MTTAKFRTEVSDGVITIELPWSGGDRPHATWLIERRFEGWASLSGTKVRLDGMKLGELIGPEFIDQLVREVLVIHNADSLEFVNMPRWAKPKLERVAKHRAQVADRLSWTCRY